MKNVKARALMGRDNPVLSGVILVFFGILLISFFPGFSQAAVDDVSGYQEVDESMTDFVNGRVEARHDDLLRVEGVDFRVSGDTRFTDMNGDEIPGGAIIAGAVVRVVFLPESDNRVVAVELQEMARRPEQAATRPRRPSPAQHGVIVLKDGVYTN